MTLTTNDRESIYLVGFAAAAVLLWWVWNRNEQSQAQAIQASAVPSESIDGGGFPIPWDSPMDDVYAANPTAYQPPTDSDLTLNINNPYAAMLGSTYMPLFGFVGIAQGVEL